MAEPFGDEPFTYSLLLVLFNRLTTCMVSAIVLAVSSTALNMPPLLRVLFADSPMHRLHTRILPTCISSESPRWMIYIAESPRDH